MLLFVAYSLNVNKYKSHTQQNITAQIFEGGSWGAGNGKEPLKNVEMHTDMICRRFC